MEVIISIFIFILGACLSSFAGVVIFRVPAGISIIKPDSFCPSCNKAIKWYDNIPIISFIILRGKCRYCQAKIGWFSFIIEILGGLGFLLSYLAYGLTYSLIFILLICFLFIIIGGIDYNTHYIYDSTQIIYFIIVLGFTLYKCLVLKTSYISLLIGCASGFIVFLLIRVIGKLIMKEECLGMGDVILMGISGLLLGWESLILAVLFGSVLGSIIELSLIGLKKKDRTSEIAFGPYLLFGTFIALLYGNTIINWYIGLVM